ncbi:MAG: hypothetical protein IKL00_03965 [Oscillospiraceae bacterium]|nr:hypothetical protein [Oscillospiraceae bacterium]
MAIVSGTAPVQRMRHMGEIIAAYLDRTLLWTAPVSDWLWQSDGSEVTLLLYHGSSDSPIIPESVEGLPVTALAPTACNYAGISSVTIPVGVKLLA